MKVKKAKKLICILFSVILCCSSFSYPAFSALDGQKKVTAIVEFAKDGVLETISGYNTDRGFTKESMIRVGVENRIDAYMQKLKTLCPGISLKNAFTNALCGAVVECRKEELDTLKKQSFVSSVFEDTAIQGDYEREDGSLDWQGIIESGCFTENGFDGTGEAIAIIDAGFSPDHEAFALTEPEKAKYSKSDIEGIINSSALKCSNATADECYVSEKIPFVYSYTDESSDIGATVSDSDHGTHTAGIAAGNSDVIKGVAPEAQLLLMKIDIYSNKGFVSTALSAIDDAAAFDVSAISISIGWIYQSPDSPEFALVDRAISAADSAGITVCASAGNSSFYSYDPDVTDNSTCGIPNACRACFSVGSSTETGMGYYSSFGVNSFLEMTVNVAAPGDAVLSAVSGNKYDIMGGTSMASPMVAGAVTVTKQYLKSKYPDMSKAKINELCHQLMMTSAVPVTDKDEIRTPRAQGAGVINLNAFREAPLVLYGDDGKCALNCGENSGTVSVSFTAENISTRPVSVTGIKPTLFTDLLEEEKYGRLIYYSLTGLSDDVPFTVSGENTADGFTLESGEKKKITFTLSADADTVTQLNKKLKNGFYLEGFVFLQYDGDNEVSIPFMSFCGDWLKQVALADEALDGFFPMKALKNVRFELLDKKGNVILTKENDYIQKYDQVQAGMWLFEDKQMVAPLVKYPSDGVYKVKMTAFPDYYGNPEPVEYEMAFLLYNKRPRCLAAYCQNTESGQQVSLCLSTSDIKEITVTGANFYNRNYRKTFHFDKPDEIAFDGYGYLFDCDYDIDECVVKFTDSNGNHGRRGAYSLLLLLLRPFLKIIELLKGKN